MKSAIVGCSSTLTMRAAMKSLSHQVVVANPYNLNISVHLEMLINNPFELNDDYTISGTKAPKGRSNKHHNLILNMNKKGRKW